MEALCSILARLKAQTGVVSATTWLVEFQDCNQRPRLLHGQDTRNAQQQREA
jgi:hypothetical protein